MHFAVWAPNARRVSVVGDWNALGRPPACDAQARTAACGRSFVPGLAEGTLYKYEILGKDGKLLPLKADPIGFGAELRPGTASVVRMTDRFEWTDHAFHRGARAASIRAACRWRSTKCTWARGGRHADGRWLDYDELADTLVPYVVEHGLHAHRADAGERASARRLVGLPAARAVRADGALRHAGRLCALRRPLPRGRARRHPRLGARAFSGGRARPRVVRRHARCTNTRIRSRASIRIGAPRCSTSAGPKSSTTWSRTRCSGSSAITSTGCASTRWRRCCYLDYSRKPGQWRPNRARRQREPGGRGVPAPPERGGLCARIRRDHDRRGVDVVAAGHRSRPTPAGSVSGSSGTWAGCTTRSRTCDTRRCTGAGITSRSRSA